MAAIPRSTTPPPYRAAGPETSGPSLDDIAQSHGYPDFGAWQAAEPELAQQAYNQQPSGDPSQATTEKPGPRGWRTIPWKQLAINFGSAIGLAFLDAASGAAAVQGADGSTEVWPAGSFTQTGNTITNAAGVTKTVGDNALLTSVTTPAAVGGGGAAALSQLSRSGQPPPLRNSPQDQPLRSEPHDPDPARNPPGGPFGGSVNQPLPRTSPFGYTPPPVVPPTVPTSPSQTYIDPSQQQRQDQQYAPGSLDQPPPAPPKPGSSLLGKILPLLGLPLDYLATRQSQNATNTATQQLVQGGQQAKADLKKVYGGVTPVLSQVVQRQQANLAPYTSLGSGAASLLGYGLGIPGVQAAPSGVYAPPVDPFGTYNQIIAGGPPPPAGSVLKSSFQQGESPFQPAAPGQTGGTPFPTTATAVAPPAAANLSSLDPRTQSQSSYVTMRSPDGEVADVARDRVAFYQAQGAQVVA